MFGNGASLFLWMVGIENIIAGHQILLSAGISLYSRHLIRDEEGNIIYLKSDFPIDAGQKLKGFLKDSLKAYEQSNYVSFIAFDSTGMSAREQAEKFSSGVPSVGVYDKGVSPGANTKLRVGVCHKTVEGREYCLIVIVRT